MEHSTELLRQLNLVTSQMVGRIRMQSTLPDERKRLNRKWKISAVTRLLGLSETYVRRTAKEIGIIDAAATGHHAWSLEDINRLRDALARNPYRHAGSDACFRLAVANFKGGVGKTTTAVNLATHLSLHGYRTLFVDLDPQGSATALLYPDNEVQVAQAQTVYPALMNDPAAIRTVTIPTAWERLSLVPASLGLYAAELELPQRDRQDAAFTYWSRLADALATVEADYDIVVIDTPPALSHLTVIAMWAAHGIVVPVQASMIDVQAMESLFRGMHDILRSIEDGEGAAKHWQFFRIAISNYRGNPRTMLDEYQIHGLMRSVFGGYFTDTPLLHSTVIKTAATNVRALYEMPVRSDPGYLRAIASVEEFGDEIIALVERSWPSRRPPVAHHEESAG